MDNSQTTASSGLFSSLGQWLKSRSAPGAKENPEESVSGPEYEEFLAQERASRKVRIEIIKRKELAELRKIRQADTNYKPNIDTRQNFSHVSAHAVASIGPQSTMEKIASIEARMANSWSNFGLPSGGGNPGQNKNAKANSADQIISEIATIPINPKVSDVVFAGSAQEANNRPVVMDGDKRVPFSYPVQLIEAASAFASGDFALTKKTIIDLIKQKTSVDSLIPCWESWFEFLLSTGDKANFENASVTFATKFGRSGPTWSMQWSPDNISVIKEQALKDADTEKKPIIWLSQAHLDAQDVLSFARNLAQSSQVSHKGRSRATLVLNWSELKDITPAAIDALSYVIHQIADQSLNVKSINHQQLLKIIQDQLSAPANSELSRSWWLLRLALLRLMNQADNYAQACLDFCIAFDETAPVWSAPECKFSIFDLPYLSEDGILASIASSNFESTQITKLDELDSSFSQHQFSNSKQARFVLAGSLTGDISPLIRSWSNNHQSNIIILECENLVRIDPTASAILLGWIRKQNREDTIIQMNQLHRLVAIYLFSIGLSVKNKINLLKL